MLYDELFDNALKIESGIESLYRKYAGKFQDDADLAAFFVGLAEEEVRHIDVLKRMQKNADVRQPAASPLPIVRSQRDMLVLIDQYLEEADGDLDPRRALRNSFRLENSLPERTLRKIGNLFNGPAQNTFRKLGDDSMEHSRRVRDFARSRDIRFT